MFNFNYKLVDDGKTTENLMDNIEIRSTSYKDALFIVETMQKCFDIPTDLQSLEQLLYTKALLNNSVKLVDKRDNMIYGFLLLCDYPIERGTPPCKAVTSRRISS